MAVPKYNEMYESVLKSLRDGQNHTLREINGIERRIVNEYCNN
jgi:hypothetical protein